MTLTDFEDQESQVLYLNGFFGRGVFWGGWVVFMLFCLLLGSSSVVF